MSDRFELIIFDADGVLVDSEPLSIRIDIEMLGRLGWSLTEAEIVSRFVGRSDADMLAEVVAHLGAPLPAGFEDEWTETYRQTLDRELQPVDGIVEALDRIRAPICVASSGSHEKIRRNLALTGLAGYFGDRIFSASDVARGKPAPDLFLHAARALGASPEACAVVEDSAYGVAAARAAGMQPFAYAGGVTPADRLEGRGVILLDDMRALPALLGEAGEHREAVAEA